VPTPLHESGFPHHMQPGRWATIDRPVPVDVVPSVAVTVTVLLACAEVQLTSFVTCGKKSEKAPFPSTGVKSSLNVGTTPPNPVGYPSNRDRRQRTGRKSCTGHTHVDAEDLKRLRAYVDSEGRRRRADAAVAADAGWATNQPATRHASGTRGLYGRRG
jgi:hypothetical protein